MTFSENPKSMVSTKNPFILKFTEMVTELEEAELKRLESQVEHGGGGAWEYLSLV
jgi:hypothetical protein